MSGAGITASLAELRPPESWAQTRKLALIVGGVATALMVVGLLLDRQQFLRSWLLGWMFWIGLAVGSLALLMLQYLTGGAWGMVIRRPLEASTRTLWLLVLLFVPLAVGVKTLYVWAHPEDPALEEVLREAIHTKIGYLNVPFFLARAALYFGAWMGLAFFLNRWSEELDRTGDFAVEKKIRTLCGPGLAIYVLTIAFAAVDWVMSLEPRWFSTIFGLLWLASQALSAQSFGIAILYFLTREGPMSELVSRAHFHDLAKLLFAFVMIWAYFAFSQYLIIWSGNLPEEITWYVTRLQNGWQWFDRAGGAAVRGAVPVAHAAQLQLQQVAGAQDLRAGAGDAAGRSLLDDGSRVPPEGGVGALDGPGGPGGHRRSVALRVPPAAGASAAVAGRGLGSRGGAASWRALIRTLRTSRSPPRTTRSATFRRVRW